MKTDRKIRVLISKPGLDGHEQGARLISRCLRDAGMEVIYGGTRQTPEMVAATALQEDVDVIGLSFLSGAHKELTQETVNLMKAKSMNNVVLVLGGIIPLKDIEFLKSLGVSAVFGPGSDTRDIIRTIVEAVGKKQKKSSND